MINLKTNYLGLELKSPIIVGACDLTSNTENLLLAEKAGAGAIVYKSLFEEQIQLENLQFDNEMDAYDDRHAEMIKLFPDIDHAGPKEHLHKLRKAKEALSIPLIASLNAITNDSWIEFAKHIEDTGVDALEINFYAVPRDFEKSGAEIIQEQVSVVKELKKILNIPVSVKLSPYYTNILEVISAMDQAGADGFVLFNKMFQPDIDLEKQSHSTPFNLSSDSDYRLALRMAGLLYGNTSASISSSGGVYHGQDIIKLIMAGSDTVQVVSSLYKKKINHIETMLEEMKAWMKTAGYKSLKDFKGKLSKNNTKDPFVYKRAQYIDLLMKSGDLLKSYSLR